MTAADADAEVLPAKTAEPATDPRSGGQINLRVAPEKLAAFKSAIQRVPGASQSALIQSWIDRFIEHGSESVTRKIEDPSAILTPIIDLRHALDPQNAPPALDFVFDGHLAGTTAAMIAPGGVGKSMFSLQLAVSIAAGKPRKAGRVTASISPDGKITYRQHENADDPSEYTPLDKSLAPLGELTRGKVLYLCLEDPGVILHDRIRNLTAKLTPAQRELVIQNLQIVPLAGRVVDLFSPTSIESLYTIAQAAKGYRLIIIDTLSRCHIMNENDNVQMAGLVQLLDQLARETGAGVLYLHHSSKASVRDGQGDTQQSSRGASALVDNARFAANLVELSKEECEQRSLEKDGDPIEPRERRQFVRYVSPKTNYAATSGEGVWFRRNGGTGLLEPVELFRLKVADSTGRRKQPASAATAAATPAPRPKKVKHDLPT